LEKKKKKKKKKKKIKDTESRTNNNGARHDPGANNLNWPRHFQENCSLTPPKSHAHRRPKNMARPLAQASGGIAKLQEYAQQS
jgi:hypothetical protein